MGRHAHDRRGCHSRRAALARHRRLGRHAAPPFLVGDLPEFIESEPNSPERARHHAAGRAQRAVAGERDQDFYTFAAKAGGSSSAM
jgi:hypothetical protein